MPRPRAAGKEVPGGKYDIRAPAQRRQAQAGAVDAAEEVLPECPVDGGEDSDLIELTLQLFQF